MSPLLRDRLSSAVTSTVDRLIAEGRLPEAARQVPVEIQDTKSPEHGDYACNLAMVAAKRVAMNPRALGELLREALLGDANAATWIAGVEVAGPGFLNFRLKSEAISGTVADILRLGDDLAKPPAPETAMRLNVEFVSVNPNGPITVGSGRGAAFGDTLCRVLEAAGHRVEREYYINDGVNSEQMRLFAESVKFYVRSALRLPAEFPEKGYRGEYVQDVGLGLLQHVLREQWTVQSAIVEVARELGVDVDRLRYEDVAAQYRAWSPWDASKQAEFDSTQRADAVTALIGRLAMDAVTVGDMPDEATFERWLLLELLGPVVLEEAEPETGQVAWRARMEEQLATLKQQKHLPDDQQAALETAGTLLGRSDAEDADLWDTRRFQIAAQNVMIERQRGDLEAFAVKFDRWFSEQALHDEGKVARVLDKLEREGVAYRASNALLEGEEPEEESDAAGEALWLASTRFGDDKDRVLVRADGRPAYIAADVAYLEDKLGTRAYDKAILILGPDHHGYIGRMYAAYQALGYPLNPKGKPEQFEIVIFQIVRFVKDGKPAPMRKRDGNIYELRDLIDELGKAQLPNGSFEEQRRIGADVARFFYLMRSHETHMDFDIDLATKSSDENPVFYAQYAHARICSVLRRAEVEPRAEHLERLSEPQELALIKKILDLPTEVARCAQDHGVHRLTTFAVELARTYHHFYDACRVVQPDQPELTAARVALCEAARIGLRATFRLIGVSAPERMERGERA